MTENGSFAWGMAAGEREHTLAFGRSSQDVKGNHLLFLFVLLEQLVFATHHLKRGNNLQDFVKRGSLCLFPSLSFSPVYFFTLCLQKAERKEGICMLRLG